MSNLRTCFSIMPHTYLNIVIVKQYFNKLCNSIALKKLNKVLPFNFEVWVVVDFEVNSIDLQGSKILLFIRQILINNSLQLFNATIRKYTNYGNIYNCN